MPRPLKALVSMNAFKGSLSNKQACEAVTEVLNGLGIHAESLPVGDGGRGTWRAVERVFGGQLANLEALGPLGEKVKARVLCLPNKRAPHTLYIECSETCGYHLVPPENRDVMRATSQGLGQCVAQARARWGSTLKDIYVGLGDSAISDMGVGMLGELGYHFFGRSGRPLSPTVDSLRQIHSFTVPKENPFQAMRFTVLCDVLNPVCGPRGSARVFARQKGASDTQVGLIEGGMENFAAIIASSTGRALQQEPMTGSAGGLGAAFLAFGNARLVPGAQFLLDWIGFNEHLKACDFAVTGEGRTDAQTLSGKMPLEILKRTQLARKKSIVISGALGEGSDALAARYPHARFYACGDKPSAKKALAGRCDLLFGRGGEAKKFLRSNL